MQNQLVGETNHAVGILILLAVVYAIASVLWPKVKEKLPDLKWVKAKMLITLGFGVFVTLTVRQFWRQDWDQFFERHGWYAWLVVILANLLFCLLFGREGGVEIGSRAAATGHGSHEEKSGAGAVAVLLIVLVIGGALASNFIQNGGWWSNSGQRNGATANTPGVQLNSGPWFPIVAKPDSWESVDVKQGAYLYFDVDGPQHIWYRFNNGPEQEFWHGRPIILLSPGGAYTIGFKSKEPGPVIIKAYATIR